MQLRDTCKLQCERACPEWTMRLKSEIGLTRQEGFGRALVWRINA